MSERIHVAVGVIYNKSRDKILISKRKNKQHLAGLWEFPGGKLGQQEDVRTALDRELHEELGIIVKQANRLKTVKHDYPDKKVLLDVWSINEWSGKVSAREGQDTAWVHFSKLNDYQFPEANQHIITSITLPSIYLISKESCADRNIFLSLLEECFSSGISLFQLRLKSIGKIRLDVLVKEIRTLANQYNVKFILNGSVGDIEIYDIDGVHFNSKELFIHSSRPVSNNYLLGASCHDEEELMQANKINVDYVFISPVFSTQSHADQKGMGWKNFNDLCKKSTVPVFALGGMNTCDKMDALENGAHGIAMISAIWDSPNPAQAVKLSKV